MFSCDKNSLIVCFYKILERVVDTLRDIQYELNCICAELSTSNAHYEVIEDKISYIAINI